MGKTCWFLELLTVTFAITISIGGESLAVAQNTYAVSWFKGKELNMVFGLQLSFARLGSTVNFNVMGPLYKYVSQFYTGYMCTGVVLMIGITFQIKLTCHILNYIFLSFWFMCDVLIERAHTRLS